MVSKQSEGALTQPIPVNQIIIVDRPEPGKEHEKVFFNSRQAQSFSIESLASLMKSIRSDGLIQNLAVRESQTKGYYDLIAGERRFRSIMFAQEHQLACFDPMGTILEKWRAGSIVVYEGDFFKVVKQKDTDVQIDLLDAEDDPTGEIITVNSSLLLPTIPAIKRFAKIPCNIIRNCSDERALRINMAENKESEPLTLKEEIAVVERLIRRGDKQDKIRRMLGTNITWVSQTAAFRDELPSEAFLLLLEGKIKRNVAVGLMSYPKSERIKLVKQMVDEETATTVAKVLQHQLEQDAAEDEAEILTAVADKTMDVKEAAQTRKKADSARKKANVAKKKKDKAIEEAGTLKQGNLEAAAIATGTHPKKLKFLSRKQLEDMVASLDVIIASKEATFDPICEQKIASVELMLVRETLSGVLTGESDPLAVIRTVKVATGKWSVPDRLATSEEFVDEDEDSASDPEFDEEIAAEYDDIDVYDEDMSDDLFEEVDNWE